MACQNLGLELRHICIGEENKAGSEYSRAYAMGGPDYEKRMKAAQRKAVKWAKRSVRVLFDVRLQNAIIKWL